MSWDRGFEAEYQSDPEEESRKESTVSARKGRRFSNLGSGATSAISNMKPPRLSGIIKPIKLPPIQLPGFKKPKPRPGTGGPARKPGGSGKNPDGLDTPGGSGKKPDGPETPDSPSSGGKKSGNKGKKNNKDSVDGKKSAKKGKKNNKDSVDGKKKNPNGSSAIMACFKSGRGAAICTGIAALAVFLVQNYNLRTEEQRKCAMKCLPLNWQEYVENKASGLTWQSVSSVPENAVDLGADDPDLVESIRKSMYNASTKLPVSPDQLRSTSWNPLTLLQKQDLIYADLEDYFEEGIPFDTSYVMVDGTVFMPSIRFIEIDHHSYKSHEELMKNRDTYRTLQGNPYLECIEKCKELHPATFAAALGDSIKDVFIDGPMAIVGGGLEALFPGISEYFAFVMPALVAVLFVIIWSMFGFSKLGFFIAATIAGMLLLFMSFDAISQLF